MKLVSINSHGQTLELACETYGAGHGDWVVLIRGLGTQMIEWSPVLVDGLTDAGLQVLVFDNRDVGLSSKMSADYPAEDMAADVIGLMNALKIERAHIFGISMGGMIAQLVAHGYPERVITMFSVMSSSGARGLPPAKPEVAKWMSIEADTREATIELGAESRVAFGSPGYPQSLAERLAMATTVYDRCFFPEGVSRQMRAISANRDRVDKLGDISLPVMVIHGDSDALLPLPHGEDTAKRIPASEFVVVTGMGHNIPDTLAPAIAGHVTAFIERSA